jgi:hypothetical protein
MQRVIRSPNKSCLGSEAQDGQAIIRGHRCPSDRKQVTYGIVVVRVATSAGFRSSEFLGEVLLSPRCPPDKKVSMRFTENPLLSPETLARLREATRGNVR